MPVDLPPQHLECFVEAAYSYTLPISLLPAIAAVEGGRSGMVSPNKNGTNDYGVMQINDVWANKMAKKFGITAEVIRHDVCTSIRVAGYILRYEINLAGGDFWKGVGRYHSRTPERHANYVRKVYTHAVRLAPIYEEVNRRVVAQRAPVKVAMNEE